MAGFENDGMLTPMLTYARRLRESHQLIAQGKGDSPEAEALAEHMDHPWYAMTPEEQQRMSGLSADLNALLDGGPNCVDMSAEQLANWEAKAREAYRQLDRGNVDAALTFLREPIPSTLPEHFVPLLQARCWEKVGDLETTLVFLKEAEQKSSDVTAAVVNLLQRLGRLDEAADRAETIIARPEARPVELYLAASVSLMKTLHLGDEQVRPILQRMRSVLERAQSGLTAPGFERQEAGGLDAAIAIALGWCCERLGDVAAALEVYSAALERNPGNADLLVSRGLARYSESTGDALRDFREALRLGARSIWPGHVLSRDALVAGANGEALHLAIQAADCAGPTLVRAQVYETIAIALARLGEPLNSVLKYVVTAVQLDPTNESIRRNEAIARALAETPASMAPREWQRRLGIDPIHPDQMRRLHNEEVGARQQAVIEQRGSEQLQVAMAG